MINPITRKWDASVLQIKDWQFESSNKAAILTEPIITPPTPGFFKKNEVYFYLGGAVVIIGIIVFLESRNEVKERDTY